MTKRERLEDLGLLFVKLDTIMNEEIFERLSKHDPWWYEVNEKDLKCKYSGEKLTKEQVLTERLNECRRILYFIHDRISECWSIARGSDEER